MNKKTFTVALIFLIVTLVWLGLNVYGVFTKGGNCYFFLIVALLFVAAAAAMVWNEFHKRKRKHLDEVNKHQIP